MVVPGLVEANFPSYRSRPKEDYTVLANSWITQVSEFPHTLRRDYDSLPPCPFIGLSPQAGKDAILAAGEEYRSELGKWEVAEERRLAYVAYPGPQPVAADYQPLCGAFKDPQDDQPVFERARAFTDGAVPSR